MDALSHLRQGVGFARSMHTCANHWMLAAFIPVFFEEAHDVVVGAPKEGVDAEFFGLSQVSLMRIGV